MIWRLLALGAIGVFIVLIVRGKGEFWR